MVYVALFRGINVGGKNKVAMKDLVALFESLGAHFVTSLLNTGNIIYATSQYIDPTAIQDALYASTGLTIELVIYDTTQIHALTKRLPDHWVTDSTVRTDVMFYLNKPLPHPNMSAYDAHIEDDIALVWHCERAHVSRSGLAKVIGTPFYKGITIRNANTLRKIDAIMQSQATP